MSNISKMRVEASQGLEVVLCDGILGIQNIAGASAANCVFLTRAEAKLLHKFLEDVMWADELWEQENR